MTRFVQSARRNRFGRDGFTFAEVLAAMVFMAILIPAVIEGLMIANRSAEVVERRAIAARLAANLLNETVVTGDWESGVNSGDFGEEWPGFRWEMNQTAWAGDVAAGMEELTVVVYYPVQGREHFVQLAALVAPEGTVVTSEEETSSTAP